MAGQGKDIGAIPEITIEKGHIAEARVDIEKEGSRNRDRSSSREEGQGSRTESRDRNRSREREVGPLQDLDLVLMSIQTGIDLDAIDVVSMTTLQENALMH